MKEQLTNGEENIRLKNLNNHSLTPEAAKALVPLVPFDTVYNTIIEAAKVAAVFRDLQAQEGLKTTSKIEYNPSRRDAY